MPPVVAIAATVFFEAVFVKVVIAAIVVGLSYYQQARARRKARDAYNKSLQDRLVMTATVDQARTRCYGRVRNVDGVLFKATWGDKKQYYSLVIALCGHEIDGVEQVMFGDTVLTLDSQGQVQDAPWRSDEANTKTVQVPAGPTSVTLPDLPIGGSVLAVRAGGLELPISVTVVGPVVTFPAGSEAYPRRIVYQVATGRSHAVVTVYKGGPGQDLSAALATRFPDLITPGEHRFSGIACLLVEMSYSQDAFPNGVPNPISAIFRGAKILDPRTGVTAWYENPALIARDWSLYANGGGCQASDLVGEDFIAAANSCDVSHAFTSVNGDGDSVTTTRPMYTCGIVCDTSANPLETLAGICESMAGDFAWPGGRLSVRAGAYALPALTITGDWLSDKGAIEMVKDAPRAELINVMTPTIANAANRYIAAPLPRVVAAPYIAIDGEEYVQEVTFEGVTDSDHAGHVASVMIKDARAAKTYTLPCNLRGLQAKIGQNATINIPEIGLSNEVMRLVGWKLDFEQLCCFLTYKATSAAIFDPDATFKRDDALPNTSLPNPFYVPPVEGVVIESGTNHLFVQSDGTVVTRVLVKWNLPNDQAVIDSGSVDVRFGTLDKPFDQWQTATVAGSESQVYLSGLEDERVYAFTLRFRNRLVSGVWGLTRSHQVVGKSAAPVAVSGLSAIQVGNKLRINRTPSAELDWDHSIYEYAMGPGFSIYSAIPAVTDRGGADWVNPAVGSLRVRARDVDSSGNIGAASTYDVTVVVYPGQAGALNSDPSCANVALWTFDAGVEHSDNSVSQGTIGRSMFYAQGSIVDKFLFCAENIPISAGRTYNLTANLLAETGNDRRMLIVVRMFRADGTEYGSIGSGSTGWGGFFGGYTYVGIPTSDWIFRRYGADFGLNTSRPIPTDVAYCRIGVWFRDSSSGSGTKHQEAQDIRLLDVTDERDALSAAYTAIANAATAQATADGKIDSFYQSSAPTSFSNGDIWFDTDDGNKQYVAVGGVWAPARDTGIGQAITAAAGAQATADGKITTFYASSAPGGAHAVGDLWFNTTDKRVYRWDGGAWVVQKAVGAGDIGTGELGNQAATAVTQDTYSLAGTTTPSGSTAYTLREVSVTPTENCVIEFTARMDGSSFFDQGAYMWWALSINGGAESTLADFVPVGVTGTYYSGTGTVAVSFSAAAGVPLYFRVKSSRLSGGPSPSPGLSQMRVTQVKR